MNDPKNPFDLLLDQFRQIVREEIAAALDKKPPAKLQYTIKEAAQMLGVKRSWLSAKIKGDPEKGIDPLPHRRHGHFIFLTRQDIEEIQEKAQRGNNGKN
jgi:hypothetical protein